MCQYHLWSYDLEGKLRGVLREEVAGLVDKSENSLFEVPVGTFGGFIFLNQNPNAAPLQEFLGGELAELLAPYHLDQMTTVMDVREPLDCNWKVVMDAFEEGYHINGIHPQLLSVLAIDPATARYRFFENHSVAVAPFEVQGAGTEKQIAGIMDLPETFPIHDDGTSPFPGIGRGLPGRQRGGGLPGGRHRSQCPPAARHPRTLTGMGLDVSALTDNQMSDNQGWVLIPNYFMTVRAGECHVITAVPHPDGDPNRCIWHVSSYMYLPAEHRDAFRAALIDVDGPGSYKYFEALHQDYVQMPRQQKGLRNNRLDHMSLVREEVVIGHYHSVVDRYMANGTKPQ